MPVCTLHVGSHGGLGLFDICVSAGSVTVSPGKPEGSTRFLGLRRVANLVLADAAVGVCGTVAAVGIRGEPNSGLILSCHGAGVGLAPGMGLGSHMPVEGRGSSGHCRIAHKKDRGMAKWVRIFSPQFCAQNLTQNVNGNVLKLCAQRKQNPTRQ